MGLREVPSSEKRKLVTILVSNDGSCSRLRTLCTLENLLAVSLRNNPLELFTFQRNGGEAPTQQNASKVVFPQRTRRVIVNPIMGVELCVPKRESVLWQNLRSAHSRDLRARPPKTYFET